MNESNKVWKWTNDNPIKAIIIIALLARILLSSLYQHITLYPDSEDYINLAERLWNFNFTGYEGERSPGYPLLIVSSFFSHLLMVILQSLMGIFSIILIYRILILADVKNKLALTITLLLSVYLPAIFFELAILTETVTLLVVCSICFLFIRLIKEQKYSASIFWLLSILCSVLVLIKPFYIFVPFLLAFILFYSYKGNKVHWTRYVIFLSIPLFTFLGWSYVNKINTGQFVSSTYYGYNLAQTCVTFAESTSPEYSEIGSIYAKYRDNKVSDKEMAMTIWDAFPELEEETGLSFPDLSKLLYDYSITTIKMNSAAYLKQVFISWCDFWKTSLYWEPHNFGILNASQIVLYICYAERILLQLLKIAFVFLIPVNLISIVRKKTFTLQAAISLIVLAVSLLQAFATYGTNSRYSFPFEMLIVVSVVLNCVQYIQYKRNRRKIIS